MRRLSQNMELARLLHYFFGFACEIQSIPKVKSVMFWVGPPQAKARS